MKNRLCKICKSSRTQKLNFEFNYFNKKFYILYCLDCKAATTHPFLCAAVLKKYYIDGYSQDNFNKNKNMILHFLRIFFVNIFILNKIEKFLPLKRNTLLDFGCGDGYLGLILKKKFKNVYFSDYQLKNNNLHIPKKKLFYITLKKVLNTKKKFDFILLRHVLEHISNPKKVIYKLSKLLNKNGKILIETPKFNVNYFWIRVFKENYFQFEVPFHLYHFSTQSIKILFDCKFKINFFKHSIFILSPSINRLFSKKHSRSLENTFLWILFTPLEFLFSFFIKQDNCILALLEKK